MADASSDTDCWDFLLHPIAKHIERYGARPEGCHFAACISQVTPRRSVMGALGARVTMLWVCGSNGSGFGDNLVPQIPCVITGTLIVLLLAVLGEWAMSEALSTYWVIYLRPPFPIGLVILLS